MARSHSIRFALLFVLGLHACAYRAKRIESEFESIDQELYGDGPGDEDEDAVVEQSALDEIRTDPLTVMTFDSIARVRYPELIEKSFTDAVAKAAMAISTGSASGVSETDWNQQFVLKLRAFNTACISNAPCTGELSFKAFLALPRADEWQPGGFEHPMATNRSGAFTNDEVVVTYLKGQGYSRSSAPALAKAFLAGSRSAANEMALDQKVLKLEEFAFLDENHNGQIAFKEILGYIKADEAAFDSQLEFALMARVQAEDFKALGCPDNLVKDIMDTTGMEAIEKAQFDALVLPDVVREFVRMDKAVPEASTHASLKKGGRVQDAFTGQLKFYQFADALPNIADNAEVQVSGQMVSIHVPTVQEVTGQKNRYEIRSKDLDKWLTSEGGMSNGIAFFTNKWKYAKKLAENVVAWADGKGGEGNGLISAAAGADEWANVAGRLALFIKLDGDKDGKVTFKEAYPFLKTWVKTPEHLRYRAEVGGSGSDPWSNFQAAVVQANNAKVGDDQRAKLEAGTALEASLRELQNKVGVAQQAVKDLRLELKGGKDE